MAAEVLSIEHNIKGEKVLFYPFEARKHEKEHGNCGSGRVLIFSFLIFVNKKEIRK